MIRVRVADPLELGGEGLVRPVGEDLEGITPWSRRVGLAVGGAVLDRLRSAGSFPLGSAIVSAGGDLGVPFLIHAVLLTREEAVSEAGVARALLNSLRQASEWAMESLVVPPLGTGAGHLDAETAARVMARVLVRHGEDAALPRETWIPVANAYEEDVFRRALEAAAPPAPPAGGAGEDG